MCMDGEGREREGKEGEGGKQYDRSGERKKDTRTVCNLLILPIQEYLHHNATSPTPGAHKK